MTEPIEILLAAVAALVVIVAAPSVASAQTIIEEWDSIKPLPAPIHKIKEVTVDPKKTAVLSLDFNSKRCTPQGRVRCFNILPRVEKVLADARAKGMFVVHAVTSNMKPEDIVASIGPKPGEPVLLGRGDKFSGNDLEKMLKDKGIDTVIVMGTSANSAVLYTVFGAVQRGFKPVVPIDTMPADTAYQEQFTIWQIANGSQLDEHARLTRTDMLKF